jgi:hypothetical protein
MRMTLSRSLTRSVPALILLICTLYAFAFSGNQLFHSTSSMWSTVSMSTSTILILLRSPARMDFSRMMWSSSKQSGEDVDAMVIVFLVGFLVVNIFIVTNVFKSVIIQEYNKCYRLLKNTEPVDLTSDPWPSASYMRETARARYAAYLRVRNERNFKRINVRAWHALLNIQKQKAKALVHDEKSRRGLTRRRTFGMMWSKRASAVRTSARFSGTGRHGDTAGTQHNGASRGPKAQLP